jgi:hypothetical protein
VIEYFVVVDGVSTEATTWTYGGPNATDWKAPPVRPKATCDP